MTSSVRAIVAAHGTLAAGLVSAVDIITGHGAALRAMTNEGRSAAGVVTALTEVLDETGAVVVFTDLPAGVCRFVEESRRQKGQRIGLVCRGLR
jgi:mannose/fructose-specific phosphotransferase system component IIA